ncbi:MAG: hypothetical protein ACF8PN_10430 [Phycisphaerales bacterium]
MHLDQVRQALKELNGERDARFVFEGGAEALTVRKAFLVPEEPDRIVKLTDGQKVFMLDAARVVWVEIG